MPNSTPSLAQRRFGLRLGAFGPDLERTLDELLGPPRDQAGR